MRRCAIDIRGDDKRLDFVPGNARPCTPVIDWIYHCEQLTGFVAVSEGRKPKDGPNRGMGILPAVFAHAWQIPFDIAHVRARTIKGRGKEQDEIVAATHEVFFHPRHSARSARRLGSSR